nr:Retrovirus-related Pol polyprotein from transposon TNT 1-94 [Ipomoea batatas]
MNTIAQAPPFTLAASQFADCGGGYGSGGSSPSRWQRGSWNEGGAMAVALVPDLEDGHGVGLAAAAMTGCSSVSLPLPPADGRRGETKKKMVTDVAHPDHARWHRVNNMVMSWILNSIHSSLANTVLYSTDAASTWTDLQERFSTANGPRIYEIEKRIATFSQRDASIADYHNHLSALWDELNQLVPPPKCSCSARHEYIAQMERRRLMQFLMGLRDTFAQPRSQLLLNVNLPTVKNAYSLLLQDESQRVQSEGHEHPVDHSALQAARIGIDAPAPLQSHISSMPQFTAAANQSSTNRAHASSSTSRPSNHRPRLRCAHCGILGHTQQVCYKLHGYPPGHKFYKKGNTNSQPITAQSTSPIPSESLQQLIRLLQEVKEPKANLVGKSLALTSIFNISNEWVIDTGATDHIDEGGLRGFGPSGAGLFITPYLILKSFEIDEGGSRGFGASGAGLFITPYLISKSFEIDEGGSRGFGPSGVGLFITPYLNLSYRNHLKLMRVVREGLDPRLAGLFITPYLILKSFEIDEGGSRGFGPSGAGLFITPYLISKSFEIDEGGSRGFGPSGAGLFITPYLNLSYRNHLKLMRVVREGLDPQEPVSSSRHISYQNHLKLMRVVREGLDPRLAGLFITPYLILKLFEIDEGGSRGFGPSGAGLFITPYLISKSFEIDEGGSRGFGPSGAGLFITPYLI